MQHAFPEDELKPISCTPQTRNKDNPADIGLNDVLGNYSLTLIDSLSTLAILASGNEKESGRRPLKDFQNSVKSLVDLYGDGSNSTARCGKRACGFDLDSKVQVFETNIRGVGGLLSAHLFAVGELPIRGYNPTPNKKGGIRWPNGFVYTSQLLDLAVDLATRLLPAFSTQTGIPYPRVNLRTGIPFYLNTEGFCYADGSNSHSNGQREVTENCAAGAGSLILEFSTLSRLIGDPRFESLAKRAFWAVWDHRSTLNLLGNGIDAESGAWTNPPLSGIGAGIDSFFEYSLKSHILLSDLPSTDSSSDHFLDVWHQAHAAVKHHIYRSATQEKHPFYAQVDTGTGALRYTWIDNLSAYYPGLLVLAGEIEEAIESHLLFSALWTRYAALPERWNTANGFIDPHFRHWAGRPEFIESTFHLYQATKDPWLLRVGEMALKDIRRRCWTECGWADLGDVVSGEKRDRMESFFLGETAKYFYLLFNEDHPLNRGDGAVVFTTEGHPLVIPRKKKSHNDRVHHEDPLPPLGPTTCPAPLPGLPLTFSNIANRQDLFHAAALAQLHSVPQNPSRASELRPSDPHSGRPGIGLGDIRSPSNYTFYPWTLPQSLIPANGYSSEIVSDVITTLTFPPGPEGSTGDKSGLLGSLQKLSDGVLITNLANMRFSLVAEKSHVPGGEGMLRIQGVGGFTLGREEMVYVSGEALRGTFGSMGEDERFERIKDSEWVDLIIDVGNDDIKTVEAAAAVEEPGGKFEGLMEQIEGMLSGILGVGPGKEQLLENARAAMMVDPGFIEKAKAYMPDLGKAKGVKDAGGKKQERFTIPAILPAGIGAAPIPSALDHDAPLGKVLPLKKIFFLEDELCEQHLPAHVALDHEVLVLRRGGCSFNAKLANIPILTPKSKLQLVVILSPDDGSGGRARQEGMVRPLLDEKQRTPAGLERAREVGAVMVDDLNGGVGRVFGRAASARGGWRAAEGGVGDGEDRDGEWWEEQGRGNAGAMGGKRRFWFESLGVRIGNLGML